MRWRRESGSIAVREERIGDGLAASPPYGNDGVETTSARQQDVTTCRQARQPIFGLQLSRPYRRELGYGPSSIGDDEMLASAHTAQQLAGATLQVSDRRLHE
jgi:hypothetical protein